MKTRMSRLFKYIFYRLIREELRHTEEQVEKGRKKK